MSRRDIYHNTEEEIAIANTEEEIAIAFLEAGTPKQDKISLSVFDTQKLDLFKLALSVGKFPKASSQTQTSPSNLKQFHLDAKEQ